MLLEVADGVAKRLYETFGDGYPIYRGTVSQGLKPPCFLLLMGEVSRRNMPMGRVFQQVPMQVQYFPGKQEGYAEVSAVADRLYEALEAIPVDDGWIRGVYKKSKITDGILRFDVCYQGMLQKKVELDKMQVLTVETGTTERER